jgi:hypothetical protein
MARPDAARRATRKHPTVTCPFSAVRCPLWASEGALES